MPDVVTHLYAWIIVNEDGDEGVPAFLAPSGWMPMVGADEARIKSLAPMARNVFAGMAADPASGVAALKFYRFGPREELPDPSLQ